MSFNFHVQPQPLIKGAQQMQNNGGGTNTGYMQQGKKKKDEEQTDEINTNYLEQDEPDILQIDFNEPIGEEKEEEKEENKKEKKGWLNNIVDALSEKPEPPKKNNSNPFDNSGI
ncbi:MAG: hypothetical protein K6C94_10025 [Candidatus Gastranaerophilales bacterium]|nr:hypothetical protein [Candidatus Gastranaerophilales bacterium]